MAPSTFRALVRGVILLWMAAAAGKVTAQEAVPSGVDGPPVMSSMVVAYVAEVPWPSYAGMANPLERWARQLSASWAAPVSESNTRLNNLRPELSLGQLLKNAGNQKQQKADVYLVHGYELLEQSAPVPLESLLVPSCNGKASMAEFVILRRREAAQGSSVPQFSMTDLAKKIVLVDRGGCGELVYRWLEVELVPVSGDLRRENFAGFRTAANSTEAVLSVYFGEAEACVVTREDYVSALRSNPTGLQSKIEEACHSPRLLRHVVACRSDMKPELRRELMKASSEVRMPLQGIVWSLTEPSVQDMGALRALIEKWQSYLPEGNSGIPAVPLPQSETPESKTSAAVSGVRERRRP